MAVRAIKVMLVERREEERQRLQKLLTAGGFELAEAADSEQAIALAASFRPAVVLISSECAGTEPAQVQEAFGRTTIRVPPLVILGEQTEELEEADGSRFIHSLAPAALSSLQVLLVVLAWEIGGEPSDGFDRIYGDLARVSIGDLLRLLLRHQLSCTINLALGGEPSLAIENGQVVDARWGRVRGQKAFNRIARLRVGSFSLVPASGPAGRSLDLDLPTLVSEAAEAQFKLEELYRRLPSQQSQVAATGTAPSSLTEHEQAVLDTLTAGTTLAELVDRVALPDWQVLQAVDRLRDRELLSLQAPASRIHVVTDSICDLLPSVVRRYGITVVPLSVSFGDRRYRDGVDLHTDEFYRMLTSEEVFPTTSPPSAEDFLQTYQDLIASGDILSIHISRKQSLTASHAEQAIRQGAATLRSLREGSDLPEQPSIRVVDSLSNSVGLGMLVVFAARMARQGLGLDEIVNRIEDIRLRVQFLFIVDTLKYLQKGGRIGKAQALLGTLLGIKPVLALQDGEVTPVEKVRGGRNVQPRLIELFKERLDVQRPVFAGLAHAVAPKWAGRLKELLENDFEIAELFVGEIGPVVGSHTGPGTVGCILFQPTEEELQLLQPEE